MTGKNPDNTQNQSEVKVHEISDHLASLRYAGMIQHALMPDPAILRSCLKDYFVCFLPRDIVSGDFYYSFCNRQKMCVAVGDCTGHGVPGALMSILGISFLNEIMQNGLKLGANRVLNMMREKVMKALNQTGNSGDTKESIDIALCIYDRLTGKMQFAGANRPLLMFRDGVMTEFKPDKMTIGVAALRETPFTNNIIDIKKGDTFYLFSDGYSDQFGEMTNKKLKYKNFRKVIELVQMLPMERQKEHIDNSFREWKGNAQQVDDVLVFGFQF